MRKNVEMVKVLDAHRKVRNAAYLGTGEAYTFTIIATLMALKPNTRHSLHRSVVHGCSHLARKTVDTHIRTLVKQGFIQRHGDWLQQVNKEES